MKTNLKTILLISMTALSFSACTSTRNDLISVSESHLYNANYGVVQSRMADQQIHQELVAMNLPTQVDVPQNIPSNWTSKLTKDKDAFYANEYVEQEEVITYKYKFDKKFYKNAEWRSADF